MNLYNIKTNELEEEKISLNDLCSILCNLLNDGSNIKEVVITTIKTQ